MLKNTGLPTEQDLVKVTPSEERRKKGAVAIFECFEKIPCDPCFGSCRRGAVAPFEDINDLPQVDWDKCNGCGLCVGACPGLAIFVLNETFSPTEDLVKLPYEFLPKPEKGQVVALLNREGQKVGQGTVQSAFLGGGKGKRGTWAVSVSVPKGLGFYVRHIVVK